MIKILDLGATIESTGETRVSYLDNSFIKTASNGIQDFWTSLKREDNKAYLHVIGMTAIGWYSCNNNGDAFTEEDLRKYHPSFVEDANVFMHHANKDPAKSYGKVVFSFYNEDMHRVELILALDKAKAPTVVDAIKKGDPIAVSMGVRVAHDKCSICGNEAKTRNNYCDCLRYNMKKILEDGRQVYALNPGPLKFFDISIVNKPADRTAWALQKVAHENQEPYPGEKSSAELGEEYEDTQEKLAAITKLSDMLKDIDGIPNELKDGKDTFRVQKALRDQAIKGPVDMEHPHLTFKEMEGHSPGGILKAIIGAGAPLSINEMAYAAGRHHMGDAFTEGHMPGLISSMGPCLSMLKHRPELISGLVSGLLNDDTEPEGLDISINIKVQPMAKKRRAIFMKMAGAEYANLEKVAGQIVNSFGNYSGTRVRSRDLAIDRSPIRAFREEVLQNSSTTGPAKTEEFTITGGDGKKYRTDRAAIRAARRMEVGPGTASSVVRAGVSAGLALAAIGAMMSSERLAVKAVLAPVLGALAAAAFPTSDKPTFVTDSGLEVPVSTLFTQVKEAGLQPAHVAPAIGAAIPGVLGLDYVYNRYIKNRKNPYYREQSGFIGRTVDKAGDAVVSKPFTSFTAGALLGSTASAAHKLYKMRKGK